MAIMVRNTVAGRQALDSQLVQRGEGLGLVCAFETSKSPVCSYTPLQTRPRLLILPETVLLNWGTSIQICKLMGPFPFKPPQSEKGLKTWDRQMPRPGWKARPANLVSSRPTKNSVSTTGGQFLRNNTWVCSLASAHTCTHYTYICSLSHTHLCIHTHHHFMWLLQFLW